MTLSSAKMARIIREIGLGIPASESKVKGKEADAYRAVAEKEVADMEKQGITIDMPYDSGDDGHYDDDDSDDANEPDTAKKDSFYED